MTKLTFHATAPFSLFMDDGVIARPFWSFDDAEAMVAEFPEHSFRIFERQGDGSMRDIYGMPARQHFCDAIDIATGKLDELPESERLADVIEQLSAVVAKLDAIIKDEEF